jgi:polar amino acid transport system permease protein
MLKTTSLLFTIAVPEIFATGTDIYSHNFKYFEVLFVVSIWYLLLTALLTIVQKNVERWYGVDRTSRRETMLSRLLGLRLTRENA